jgi:hypothetical protein
MNSFPLKLGDTKREVSRKFRRGGRVIPNTELQGVTARIKVENAALITKQMVRDTADGVSWFYRFTANELIAIGSGEHLIDFDLEWPEGDKATDPSVGDGYTLIVKAPLS